MCLTCTRWTWWCPPSPPCPPCTSGGTATTFPDWFWIFLESEIIFKFQSGLVLDVSHLYKVNMVVSSLTTMSSMYFWRYSNYILRPIYLCSQFLLTESSLTSQGDSQTHQNHQSTYQNGHSWRYAYIRYIRCSLWSLGLLPFGDASRPEDRAMPTLPQIVPPQQGVNQRNEVPPQVRTP